MIEGKLNILMLGYGAREHAYLSGMKQSPLAGELFVTIGNAGINQIATPLDISPEDIPGIVQVVADRKIDLVVSGPEGPYALGLVDQGLEAFKTWPEEKRPMFFGPTQNAARIESSKIWAAGFNWRHNIPQPRYVYNDNPGILKSQMRKAGWTGFAAKAEELDGGKGVVVCNTLEEGYKTVDDFMVERIHGLKVGNRMIVQEKEEGPERTIMAWVDKDGNYAILPPSQDHKALNGKNTGGMRVYAPAEISVQAWEIIHNQILRKAINGMSKEGHAFMGLLYAGIMLTPDGPKVLEWNCRGGDPEIESVLPLYSSDFDIVNAMIKCINGRVTQGDFWWRVGTYNTTVILASAGYPDPPKIGEIVNGLDQPNDPRIQYFHGGTQVKDGQVITSSGRVLAISATSYSTTKSRELAYGAAKQIHFNGMQYLEDLARN